MKTALLDLIKSYKDIIEIMWAQLTGKDVEAILLRQGLENGLGPRL